MDMDESYSLQTAAVEERVIATVNGSYFGLRHGLETLAQLVVYDDIRNHVLVSRLRPVCFVGCYLMLM